jgi:hypothetical protein
MSDATQTAAPSYPDVLVHRVRRERFVEFEFRQDEMLTVELILPFDAFESFRRARGAQLVVESDDVAQALAALRLRSQTLRA